MEMRSAWSNGGSDAHGEYGMPWHDFHESEIDHFYAKSGLASPQNAASLGSTKGVQGWYEATRERFQRES